MPGIRARTVLPGHPPDRATVGECLPEKYCSLPSFLQFHVRMVCQTRQMTENIKNFVMVEDFDKVLAKVEKLGGKIVMPRTEINGVGLVAIIQDTEGNGIGLWKPKVLE